MLRVLLDRDDLLRTTVAPGPSAAWEIVQSLRLLRHPGPAPRLAGWRSRAYPRISPVMRPLLDLVPAGGYAPDFLVVAGSGADLEAVIDRVLATPRARLRADLAPLPGGGRSATRLRGLWDGDLDALRRLGEAMRAYHAALIEPEWTRVATGVEGDRARRGQQMASGGMGLLLGTLHPEMVWDAARLSYRCGSQEETEVRLDGRGLTLQPSLFAYEPGLAVPGVGAPVLAYPVAGEQRTRQPREGLIALLGRTRAAVLAAVGTGATTTQLAHRVGVSLASASQHAGVLRSAGLVTTCRTGPAVLHSLTPLGSTLLEAQTSDTAAN